MSMLKDNRRDRLKFIAGTVVVTTIIFLMFVVNLFDTLLGLYYKEASGTSRLAGIVLFAAYQVYFLLVYPKFNEEDRRGGIPNSVSIAVWILGFLAWFLCLTGFSTRL